MADHPLRPATDRRLGRLLPYQLANRTQAILKAPGPKVPSFAPQSTCGISLSFLKLSPSLRHIPTRYSPVRHSPPIRASSYRAAVRLACVKRAASVQSEPGSNSSVLIVLCILLLALLLLSQAPQYLIWGAHSVCLLKLLMNFASKRAVHSTDFYLRVNAFFHFF